MKRANEVRSERRALKVQLRVGDIKLSDIAPTAEEVSGMRVEELLRALPWTRRKPASPVRFTERGGKRALLILQQLRIPSHTTVERVVEHDLWDRLCSAVARNCISQ